MERKKAIVSDKFTVRVIGDHEKISGFDKQKLNDSISKFVSDFEPHFGDGELVIDIRRKKGIHNFGKYRKVPLFFTNARFSTDKGFFIAKKENWGALASVHDALALMKCQITKVMKRNLERERELEYQSDILGAET